MKNKSLIVCSIGLFFALPAYTMRFFGDGRPHPSAQQAGHPKENAEKCLGKTTTPRVEDPKVLAKSTGISTGQQIGDGATSSKHSVVAMLAKQQAERRDLIVQHDHRRTTQQAWLSDDRPLSPSQKYVQPLASRDEMERVVAQAQSKKCTLSYCEGNKKYVCAGVCLLATVGAITPCCVYIPECQACCCAVMSGLNFSS